MEDNATFEPGKDSHYSKGAQPELGDIRAEVHPIGRVWLKQGETTTSGMMVSEDGQSRIILSLAKVAGAGFTGFDGLGIYTTLGPDEARILGEGLISMANGGLASVIPDDQMN